MENIMNKKNVLVESPSVGDILALDAAKNIRFIAHGSYDSASLPEGMTAVGVVAVRQGNQVLAVNKNNTTKKWCGIFRWKVTGFVLDGSEHTTTISVYSSQKAPSQPVFTYKASTIDGIVPQLQAWLDAYSAELGNKSYKCYVEGDAIKVFLNPFANWYEYVFNMSGLTVNYDVAQELPANSNIYGKNHTGSYYKGMNYEQFYYYLRNEAGKDWWPEEPISSLPSTPMPYDCYISEIGAYARNIFGEGEEGFKKYVENCMVAFPSQRGALAPEFNDGLRNTYILEAQTIHGTSEPMYPAARYCADVQYENKHLARGRWFLPSMHQLCKIVRGIKRDYSDKVNQSLSAIGGNSIALATPWSSSRCNDVDAWIFNGYRGCTAYSNFYYSNYAWPCVLLDMNEVNL